MDYKEIIDRLINELSFRVGIPDLKDKEQQAIISEILSEWGEFDAKQRIFEFLTEAEPEKSTEDDKYTNTGGSGYVKAQDYNKWKSDPKGYEGQKFTKTPSGKYIPKTDDGGDGEDKEEKELGSVVKAGSDYAKDQAELKKRVADKEDGGESDKNDNKSKPKFPKKVLNNKWEGKTTKEIIDGVSTSNDPKVIPTKGSDDVSKRAIESRQIAFGGKAGKGGGDTTIQEEMTNIGRELLFSNPDITQEELAKKISEEVKQKFPDSNVAQNASKLKKLSNASIAGFGSAKKIQNNPKFKYNKNQPTGYPVNTTDGILVRDTLSTQLVEAEKSGNQEDIDHAKNELYEFQKNAADKSITGKEGDADTIVIYKDTNGRDRVCYISNKQSLNDQQSSGTINSSKKALTFASTRLGLTDNEKEDVLTIAEEQFQKANQFDETFAKGVKTAAETHKERLSTPQAQTSMAKAAQALSGRSKIAKPNDKLTPIEKKKKESYITDSLKKPEVQAKLLGLDGPPNDDITSKEYKSWKKDTTEQYKINGGEYSNEQITHAATMVTGTGGISRGNHLRTSEKITTVSRDIYRKMKKLIDGGMSKEEAVSKLKKDFDKPNKKGEVMYGGVFDESDLIELYDNDGLRDMETAERQRGEDIREMQTETVSRLVEKDKEEGHTPPPVNGKRTQAYVAGFFDRVHITQNVGGTADGRKLTEMGEYSVSPKDYRNALAITTDFPTEQEWLEKNPKGDYNTALETHLIGNVTVEGVEQELHYVSTDGKKKHIGTDTHRTGGKISKVAGTYGKDFQEELARQSEQSSNK